MPIYAVGSLRDFWVRVYTGEGQLSAVTVRPLPSPPRDTPKITNGVYDYQYGLPDELINAELRISADVARVNRYSDLASITIELWQTIPDRYRMGPPPFVHQRRRLEVFTAEGSFDTDDVARISYAIDIIV